ncbi:GDPmannose 4,6-dehydratase [Limimonas halophila]|uniref:GDP-mannose 4,6-dehydratase n=1 Tax=Limimonas halophila TaxID=1082479 RepID=A0A1G7Q2L2_9PROT|nr:GDP-mannose 4,6-dehydratase [Limimonas halophila]SDF92754.1 GDPmannose 4,6-dehydratase [Limimonas halophila]
MIHRPRRKRALITGATGQDGAFLAELLLAQGYAVHAFVRRTSGSNLGRVAHLVDGSPGRERRYVLHHGDMTDTASLMRVLAEVQPDEIYNLAAQSHVAVSFDAPEDTANTDALGVVRLLEAVRTIGLTDRCRIYQASTSELFGASPPPQDEATRFRPCSPYGAAKVCAYWMGVTYREAYGLHLSNGIAFNHESPLRGDSFVTRKITRAVARIADGEREVLRLGNLDAGRDWAHARDVVAGMWSMLQQAVPDDYVLATGESHSVRSFVAHAFDVAGLTVRWEGEGVEEVGVEPRSGRVLVAVDPALFRPRETQGMRGDAGKARRVLGWAPRTSFAELVAEMVRADLAAVRPPVETVVSPGIPA